MIEIDDEETGIIIEVKYPDSADLETGAHKALEQIADKNYIAQLKDFGMTKVLKYGIACYRKRCKVALEIEEVEKR